MDSRKVPIVELPKSYYSDNGWEWFLGGGEWTYIGQHILSVTKLEAMEYIRAADDLYKLFQQGAQYVIDNNLWMDLGIHPNLVDQIKYTWNNEAHVHLYGRFDFAGGLDAGPVKLLEFNADTPTSLPETAFIQQEQMIRTQLGNQQFNTLFQDLVASFERLIANNPDKHPSILFSSLGHEEDEINARLLMRAAEAAGLECDYEPLEDVVFSADEGIFVDEEDGTFTPYHFWCKLVPWEFISHEEPELMDILNKLVLSDKLVITNPAYSLLYQSKAMMAILWDLFPNHPMLLKTSFDPPARGHRSKYVEKVLFGREGENVTIYDENNFALAQHPGNYDRFPKVYQEFGTLPNSHEITYYQPMLYFSGNPSALSFRKRDSLIMDEDAEFIGHFFN